MKHTVTVIFGKEQVIKINNGEELTSDELRLNVKEYSFDTENEKRAFIRGVDETAGWIEYCVPEFEFTSQVKQNN